MYVEGVPDIHLVYNTVGKDQHDLKTRHIDHKDKQNYDAVLHTTSESVTYHSISNT